MMESSYLAVIDHTCSVNKNKIFYSNMAAFKRPARNSAKVW